MDDVLYRFATLQDVPPLIELRLAFLIETSGIANPPAALREQLRKYFTDSISKGEFIAALAIKDSRVIASSGMVFHFHPPGISNPSGSEAYIMNMYTLPAWRRRGIGGKLLDMLLDHVKQAGCLKVFLHAMPKGRSIYVNAGFIPDEKQMRLDL